MTVNPTSLNKHHSLGASQWQAVLSQGTIFPPFVTLMYDYCLVWFGLVLIFEIGFFCLALALGSNASGQSKVQSCRLAVRCSTRNDLLGSACLSRQFTLCPVPKCLASSCLCSVLELALCFRLALSSESCLSLPP